MDDPVDRFASKADVIYKILYEQIRDGTLSPGARLVEQTIADSLGVSKTPVREALRMLKEQGLAVIEPYRGTRVAEFSIDALVEIMEIRAVLDGLASRKAAALLTADELKELRSYTDQMAEVAQEGNPQHWVELNWEFHSLIAAACGSEELLRVLSSFHQKMLLSSVLGIATNMQESLGEHERLLEALEKRDADAAERAARAHVENTNVRVASLRGRQSRADALVGEESVGGQGPKG